MLKTRKLLDRGGSNNDLGDGPWRCLSRRQIRWLHDCVRHRRQPWPSQVAGGFGSTLPPDQNHTIRISRPTRRVTTDGRGKLDREHEIPPRPQRLQCISSPHSTMCAPRRNWKGRSWRWRVWSGHVVPCGALGCPPWVHSGPPLFYSIGNSDETKTDGWVMGLWESWLDCVLVFSPLALSFVGTGVFFSSHSGFFSTNNFLCMGG
jgi:hypothetical protein